jgi:hypothetical protein
MTTPSEATASSKSEEIDNTVPALINHRPELMNWRRLILLVLLAMAFSVKVGAESLSLKSGLTHPFYAPALNVQWAAPTNDLPRTVIVFEVVPDRQPEVTVSNLMRIGRFRLSDRVERFDADWRLPKGVYAFRAADDGRTLVYFSPAGQD